MIQHITTDTLKNFVGIDGLILQGCGGNPAEWLKGINETLTEAGILLNGSKFEDLYVFEHDGLTDILFDMDDVELDIGKLAMWRLQTHHVFGGTWLSDYLSNRFPNRLSEPEVNGVEIFTPERDDPYSETGTSGFEEKEPDRPLSVFVENKDAPDYGSFTIPLPTTEDDLRPFLEGAQIFDWRDMSITEIHSDIEGLGERLTAIVSKDFTSNTLNELNYLAERLGELSENDREIFSACTESRRDCDSIAEIINLTFPENLKCYDLQPAFSAEMYGEHIIENVMLDVHADALDKLEASDDPRDRDLAKYVESMAAFVDYEAFGRDVARKEGGVFTDHGYLTKYDSNTQEFYKSPHDIPDEHRIHNLSNLDNINIAMALIEQSSSCRFTASDAGGVFISPDKDAFLAVNMREDLDFEAGLHRIAFDANVRTMGVPMEAESLDKFQQESKSIQEMLVYLESQEFVLTPDEMEAFVDSIRHRDEPIQFRTESVQIGQEQEQGADDPQQNINDLHSISKSDVMIAESMTKDKFWQIIDDARETGGIWQNMYPIVVDALSALEASDIVRFKQIYNEYQSLAYKDKLWAAASIINNGCSDDGFVDFRAWLIAQGKEVYMNALADPDSLADLPAVSSFVDELAYLDHTPPNGYFNSTDFEHFSYVANEAYENKLGESVDIYDVINTSLLPAQEKADIANEITYASDIDAKWGGISTPQEEINAQLKQLCPELHRHFSQSDLVEPIPGVPQHPAGQHERPDEKPSVLDQIRQSRQASDKQPTESKQEPETKDHNQAPTTTKKHKGAPEL